MIDDNDLFIGKCLYTEIEHEELVRNMIVSQEPDNFLYTFDEKRQSPTAQIKSQGSYSALNQILRNIAIYAPFIKHESFLDEEEWRIVATDYELKNKRLKNFREGRGFIVPYLEIPLVEQVENNLPQIEIDEIIVGPTPHMSLAVNACQMFRNEYLTKITPSEIPYRNW